MAKRAKKQAMVVNRSISIDTASVDRQGAKALLGDLGFARTIVRWAIENDKLSSLEQFALETAICTLMPDDSLRYEVAREREFDKRALINLRRWMRKHGDDSGVSTEDFVRYANSTTIKRRKIVNRILSIGKLSSR